MPPIPELFVTLDGYIDGLFAPEDPVLTAALADADAAGLPDIQVSAGQGRFIYLLAKLVGARRILEIGTLGGYSTIWLARALPPFGRLITLELDPTHARVAAENVERAGLSSLVEIRVGSALESLARLHADKTDPFDLIFLDADKPNNPNYLEWALKLSRPGTLIIGDNVIRDGEILDATSTNPTVSGTRTFL